MTPPEATSTSELLIECESKAECQEISDPYIRMFAKALGRAVLTNPEIGEAVSKSMHDKQKNAPFPASYAFNSLLRLYQMENMDDTSYPFEHSGLWDRSVSDWLGDPSSLQRTVINMLMWNVGSDVETRSVGPKIIAHCWNPKGIDENEGYKILSVGSARDHGLAAIASNLVLPKIEVDPQLAKQDNKYNLFDTIVNQVARQPLEIGDCYGVDLWTLRDPEWSNFLEACRFYPSELKDPEKRHRYKRLEALRDCNPLLHHTNADFADIDGPPANKNGWLEGISSDDSYDMILFSTSLYQNYPDKRRVMFENAKARLRRNGLVVIQDFCKKVAVPETQHVIDSYDFPGPISNPYTYTTYVYDSSQPQLNLQECFSWLNGRCESYRPSQRIIDVVMARVISGVVQQ